MVDGSAKRRPVSVAPDRRDWQGSGGPAPEWIEPVLALARRGKQCAWEGLARRVRGGRDQLDVERLLWAGVDAGLVIVSERRIRSGDWEPYRWRLTEAGEARIALIPDAPDVAGYLATADGADAPVLASIRVWLERGGTSPTTTRLVMAIGRELRAGRLPRERLLSKAVTGSSKAIRIDDHREALEAALGGPLDELVRKSGDAAIVAGPIRFVVRGVAVDARGVPPWLALPGETVDAMESLSIDADRLLTIENLTPFEEEVSRGLEPRTVALYLGGFAGAVERRMLQRFIDAGIQRIDHWGDMDVGGLRILRHVRSLARVDVRPFRMEPELLDRLPTDPLTDADQTALRAWLADPDAPDRDLASAILTSGRKAEQEGWFLRIGSRNR